MALESTSNLRTRWTCGNCGRLIGAMEQPYQWGDAVVCPQCCQILQQASEPPPVIAGPLESLAAAKPRTPRRPSVQTIEKTGKVYKAHMLIGTLMALAGIVLVSFGSLQNNHPAIYVGAAVVGVGATWGIVANSLAWWHHG